MPERPGRGERKKKMKHKLNGIPAEELSLYDSETAECLTENDLGITEAQYQEIIIDGLNCGQAEGHVRPDSIEGRRVYASE